jgi:hypothetical protein
MATTKLSNTVWSLSILIFGFLMGWAVVIALLATTTNNPSSPSKESSFDTISSLRSPPTKASANLLETRPHVNIPSKQDQQDPLIIPALVIHLVHISPGLPQFQEEIPLMVRNNLEDWKILHPNWTVTLWDNNLARQEFPLLIPLFMKIKTMGWNSDLLRYHLLEKYGGIYVDTDIVPMKSLESLRSLKAFTVCQTPRTSPSPSSSGENILMTEPCETACNAVIGSTRHHPTLVHAVNTSMDNTLAQVQVDDHQTAPKFRTSITGPPMWTQSVLRDTSEIQILHATTFYPCDWKDTSLCVKSLYKDQPHAFAMHTWAHSWKENSSSFCSLDLAIIIGTATGLVVWIVGRSWLKQHTL